MCAARARPSAKYTPRRSRTTSCPVTRPATVARYVFGTSYLGCASRFASAPSFVITRRPLESASSRPTGKSLAFVSRTKSTARVRPAGS